MLKVNTGSLNTAIGERASEDNTTGVRNTSKELRPKK